MSDAVRVAAVDCGTNSIRLLVADVDPVAGTVSDLDRRMEVVRLGQGVDATGRLAPEALKRTWDAARRYREVADGLGARRLRFVATSATRDAANRDEFAAGVLAACGVEPEVVDGLEEAELSFRGATSAAAAARPGPYLVVDIGGGSTELVLGTRSVAAAASMDIGCVRLTERHLHSDPPTEDEVAAAAADVDAALDEAGRAVPFGRAATLVGVAGSVTTVTAHGLGLRSYEPERIDGAGLPVETVLGAADNLLRRTRAERAALEFMHPGRVDVIGAGALVWSLVVARVAAEVGRAGGRLGTVLASEHDILDGIALSVAEAHEG